MDDDYDETTGLEGLSKQEVDLRAQWLWLNLFLKARGSATILSTFESLNHRILEFGTKRGIIKSDEEEIKPRWFIIMPNS